MPNRVNQLLVKQYMKAFEDKSSLISIGYEGLSVESTNAMRNTMVERGYGLLFVKNRIANIAFKEMGRPDISAMCEGQTAFADSEDPVSLARFLVDFRKEHKEIKIHGALVENTVVNEAGVIDLSKSPTKAELKGMISGQALSPGAKVSGALLGAGAMLASQIKKLADGESGETAA
jgi:large subunit ribosomal protein L10